MERRLPDCHAAGGSALSVATTTDAGTLPPSPRQQGPWKLDCKTRIRGCRAKRSPVQSCELVPLIDTLGFRSSDYTEKKSTYSDSFLLMCQLAKEGRNAGARGGGYDDAII